MQSCSVFILCNEVSEFIYSLFLMSFNHFTSRDNGLPTTMKDVQKKFNVNKKEFNTTFLRINESLKLQLKLINSEVFIESICTELG